MSVSIDYSAFDGAAPQPIKELFTKRRIITTFSVVMLTGTAIFFPVAAQAGFSANALAGFAAVVLSLPLLTTPILLLAFRRRPNATRLFLSFAEANGFALQAFMSPERSIIHRSTALNEDTAAERRYRISGNWRLEGTYNGTSFALERLEKYFKRPLRSAYRNFPQFITVLEIPVKADLPKIALRSRWLQSGRTVFETSCILPSSNWRPFMFQGLADANYEAYFIDSDGEFQTAEQQAQVEALLRYLPKEGECDIELSNHTLYVYFNGGLPAKQEAFERFFRIIKKSQELL